MQRVRESALQVDGVVCCVNGLLGASLPLIPPNSEISAASQRDRPFSRARSRRDAHAPLPRQEMLGAFACARERSRVCLT
jgi:hypothetical protein